MNRIMGLACLLLFTAAAAADTLIQYDGSSGIETRWGAVYDTDNTIEPRAGWVGGWNGFGPPSNGFFQIGIFDLTGVTIANSPQIRLRIPETDNFSGGSQSAFTSNGLTVYHIDAASDTTISVTDSSSAALSTVGVYRAPGPLVPTAERYREYDVTDEVHADIVAGRMTFAYRIQHDPSVHYQGYARFLPTASNPIVLIIKTPGTVEGPCNDAIDNDGDGLIDCADADCTNSSACPEICNNGIDDDANGLVDCNDPDCLGSPFCPEVGCDDGIDNDGDGLIDCADPDCAPSPACPENCTNGVDDNADGLVDCDDPRCADFPSEPCRETLCGDGSDNDNDDLIDCVDPDCAGSLACGGSFCVKPTSPQDGYVIPGVEVNNTTPFGAWGSYNATPWTHIGIHNLPPGAVAADVGTAFLRIPQTDNAWTVDDTALNLRMLLKHIDAATDVELDMADGSSTPLGDMGVYREPGPYVNNNSRYVLKNVTAEVKGDLAAGRTTFAWRIEPEAIPNPAVTGRYFPNVENTDPAFNTASPQPAFGPSDNHGAVLCILAAGLTEDSCTDGIDNDNNGLTDCQDPACTDDPACPENCTNGIDDNGDGLVDCDDPQCVSSPACPERLCADGLDNDGDGLVDCADPDCFGGVPCGNETGHCTDSLDNDNDCLSDGADPDCSRYFSINSTSQQNAAIYDTGGAPEPGAGWVGGWNNGAGFISVGMMTLSGLTAGDVTHAVLRIPEQDTGGGGVEADYNANTLTTYHIDAIDDTKVSVGDDSTAALGTIGIYRTPGPSNPNLARYVQFDVTSLVQADLTAGRGSFAWRIQHDPGALYHGYRRYTTSGSNRPVLIITKNSGEQNCSDGSDNDGDGLVDCADADCYPDPACSTQEVCGDGIDNNGNGLVDCQDTLCIGNPCCAPLLEICTNGVDDTGNGLVDCEDPQCTCAPNCGGPQPENCTDGVDNDCNDQVDCQDSACATNAACLNCNNPFADKDGDGDVDMDDFAEFQLCFSGPVASTPAGCGCFDRNMDGHISQPDLEAFQACGSGSRVPANPNCDGAP